MNAIAKRVFTGLFVATTCLASVTAANAQQSLLGLGAAGWQPSNNSATQVQQPQYRQPVIQQPTVQYPVVQQPSQPLTQPGHGGYVESESEQLPLTTTLTPQPGNGLRARQMHVVTVEFLVTDSSGQNTTVFNRDYTTHVFNEATNQWVPLNNWRSDLDYHVNWMEQRGHTVTPSVVRRTQSTVIDRDYGGVAPASVPSNDYAPTN